MTDLLPPTSPDTARREIVPTVREQALGAELPPRPERVGGVVEPRERPPSFGARIREGLAAANPKHIHGPYGLRPLVLVSFMFLITGWDDAVFSVFGSEIRRDLDLDIATLTAFTSIIVVVSTFLAPVVGYFADRVNRIRLLVVGTLISNFGSVLSGASPSGGGFAGARAVTGVGGSISGPTVYPLLTDWYGQEARARVFAFYGVAGRLAGVVGPIVAAGVGTLLGWRAGLMVLGAAAMASALPVLFLRDPTRGAMDRRDLGAPEDVVEHAEDPMSWGESWRAAASVTTVRRIWYATPFMTIGGEGLLVLVPLYYAEEFGLTPFARSAILAATLLVGIVGALAGAPFADRLLRQDPARLMVLFGLLAAVQVVPVIVLIFSPWLGLTIAIGLVTGVLPVIFGPGFTALLSMVVPARLRGLGMQTFRPWELLGRILLPVTLLLVGDSIRAGIAMLIPVFVIGALFVVSTAGGVAADIRRATAAALASEETRRARAEGRTKLLVCRDVDVTYDGAQVLFNVDFDVEDGELVALVGTNGAGKSTLLRAIAGVQEASNGAIFLDGQDITHRPPAENAAKGVVFVPGGRAIFPSLSVADNLRTAGFLRRDDDEWVRARTEEVLDLFPVLRDRLDEIAGNLSGGEQQMLAVGQAFLMEPRLLMIDELSLGLAPAVVERLLDVVRRINDAGTTVILVEQSLNVALTVARRAVFLEKGQVRFDGPTEELLGRSDLVRAVFLAGAGGGVTRVARRPAPSTATPTDAALVVDDVHVSFGGVQALRGASVSVRPGEVVGIIGPNGAGKTTLFDVVSGFTKPDAGTVLIAGTDVTAMGPDARARMGLARSFQNARLFPSLTVRDNIAAALELKVAARSAVAAALWLPSTRRAERRVRRRVEWLVSLFALEAYADKFVNELSTGTRRIVDMACITAAEPSILLLDEPSSGLAQAETEALVPVVRRFARDTGCGVLVIEHDIPLVTTVADQLVAFELGRPIVSGPPADVVADPRVVEAYLGADPAVVARSGQLTAALRNAGLTTPSPEES